MADPLALEVRRLAALVAELIDDAQHAQRRQLAADDRAVGSVLLPLAAAVMGEAAFDVDRLQLHALSDRTPAGQALCEVIAEYGSPKAVGKLLRRLDGIAFDGVRLVPARQSRSGNGWRLVRLSGE